MSFRATVLRRLYLAVGLVGLTTLPSLAQNPPATPMAFPRQGSDAITTTMVPAPILGSSSRDSSSRAANWLKVEIHYAATPLVGDFLNEITFKIWVEGRDQMDPQSKPGEGIAVCLTGSVTYVNVPRGRDVYGVVFIHPDTLARYSSSKGVSEFERNYDVHVEASVDGKPIYAIDKKNGEEVDWQTKPRAVPGLIFLQNQSPFINYDPSRYPALKLPESGAK